MRFGILRKMKQRPLQMEKLEGQSRGTEFAAAEDGVIDWSTLLSEEDEKDEEIFFLHNGSPI